MDGTRRRPGGARAGVRDDHMNFDRFTEKARAAVAAAEERRIERGGYATSTVDLLVALARMDDGMAQAVLAELGFEPQDIIDATSEREEVWIAVPAQAASGVPFTTQAFGALDNALREALSLGHNYVGTEHLLLGLVRQEGSTSRAWADQNVDGGPDGIRDVVIRMLSGEAVSTRAPSPVASLVDRLDEEAAELALMSYHGIGKARVAGGRADGETIWRADLDPQDVGEIRALISLAADELRSARESRAARTLLAELVAERDRHVEVYGYEKQHYLIDSPLWNRARDATR